ncbi:MAG: ABC transporter ATP-binding protein [Eubacteriales bacterium]|nr:ABC transporter ATP-binding protein [Eubacteriales bacterium]
MLTASRITLKYGERTAVSDLSFSLAEGQWLMVIGPNGAGKSSLIAALSHTRPFQGMVNVGGQDIRALSPRRRAQMVGVLAQRQAVHYAFTVEEVVRLGRYAHRKGWLAGQDPQGEAMVEQALHWTGMSQLKDRSILTLSGGERQRAFLAQVLAQDPAILMLDEPAGALDLKYQKTLFELTEAWAKQPGKAVISVVHDLSVARRYGSHALLMREGKCLAQGEKDDVLSPKHLNAAYGMDVGAWMRALALPWVAEEDAVPHVKLSAKG